MPSFYEFFAGGGMARAGLGLSWDCLFANDFDPKKAASYKTNWGDTGLHVENVASLSTFDLPGKADLVWASFPCQDLSLAGNGAGLEGSRSGTFWPFWRLMQSLKSDGRQPKIVVLENVCGLLTSRNGDDFRSLCQQVSNSGYRFGAVLMDAARFVPQSRPRLFVIAVREDLAVDAADLPSSDWHSARLVDAVESFSEPLKMRWIWFRLPSPPPRNLRLIDMLEPDDAVSNWHNADYTQQLCSMMSDANRRKLDMALSSSGRHVGAVYKRTRIENGVRIQRAEIRFDGLAGCLRTPGGGSSRQAILIIDDGVIKSRLLSPRETARLMGLSDEYVLPQNFNDALHLTGDGVAVPVVRFLSENIIEPLLHGGVSFRAIAA
jgi:DNA (cytosine-5)-methyltransferase 1